MKLRTSEPGASAPGAASRFASIASFVAKTKRTAFSGSSSIRERARSPADAAISESMFGSPRLIVLMRSVSISPIVFASRSTVLWLTPNSRAISA